MLLKKIYCVVIIRQWLGECSMMVSRYAEVTIIDRLQEEHLSSCVREDPIL